MLDHTLLIGFKGCGKTTVGSLVAARLGHPFIDLDNVIEDLHRVRNLQHEGYRTIFGKLGARGFRELEHRAANQVCRRAEGSLAPLVIALGGGAIIASDARRVLSALGRMVYLRVSIEELVRRAELQGFPAYVTERDRVGQLARMFAEREPIYTDCADLVVDVGELSPDVAADAVIEALHG